MRVMRAEPRRFTDVTPRSVGAVWRAYDLQLTTYAALLGAIGLVMAYTNSVEAGESVLRSGTTFTRALMWSGLGIVVFTLATLFDYHWLKAMRWPICVMPTAKGAISWPAWSAERLPAATVCKPSPWLSSMIKPPGSSGARANCPPVPCLNWLTWAGAAHSPKSIDAPG